jgi:hypothetical protein
MRPIEIPPGTTLKGLFTDVLPATHAKFVSQPPSTEAHVCVFRFAGGPSFTVTVRGREVEVRDGEVSWSTLWVATSVGAAERILADWTGAQRFLPKSMPQGALALSDPRILKRLMMVSGRIELAVPDFHDGTSDEGPRISLTVGAGEAAKKGIITDEPDAVVEVRMAVLERILGGNLPPEEAIAGGHVTLRGKTLVAMQFALALAPMFPAKR